MSPVFGQQFTGGRVGKIVEEFYVVLISLGVRSNALDQGGQLAEFKGTDGLDTPDWDRLVLVDLDVRKSFHLHVDFLGSLVVKSQDKVQVTEHHACRQSQLRGDVPLLKDAISIIV
jgi:hypothetical protein